MSASTQSMDVDLLGHARTSPWRGQLSVATHRGRCSNPACGDEVSLELEIRDGHVVDVRFEGRGCFLSQAGASVLCQRIFEQEVEEVSRLGYRSLLGYDPAAIQEARRPCAALAYEALQKALGRNRDSGINALGRGDVASRYSRRIAGTPSRTKAESLPDSVRDEGGSEDDIFTQPISTKLSNLRSPLPSRNRSSLKGIFDAVYCVNLDRRPDRWDRFRNQIPADWPFDEIQRFRAVDGQRVSPPAWWRPGRGAWGCYRSHLALIEEALNTGLRSVLLFEDDAVFCPEFTFQVSEFLEALPSDWGMIYLGGQHLEVNHTPPQRINDLVYRPYNVNRTHAFAIRGKMLEKVYQHLCRNDWHRNHHIDHHLGLLHHQRDEPIYCPARWLVGQDEGKSNISGRVASKRFWVDAGELVSINPEDELFVAVLGLHSSGSSCLAGVLYHLGLHLGNRLTGFYGNNPANNKCGFEAAGLRDICEAAIPFAVTAQKLSPFECSRRLHGWINQKRREAASRKTIAAGKYPQLCQLGKSLLEICGQRLMVIVADRPIEQSIGSLRRRCPRQNPADLETHQRWLEEGKQWILSQIPESHALSVSYEDLLNDPEAQTLRIASFLEITPTRQQLEAIIRWVDPQKQHVKG